jgi:bla regulator protein blaR1
MLAWMVYAALVALALGGAAWMAERAARQRQAPTRWPWVLSLAASVLLPLAVANVTLQRPSFLGPTPHAGAGHAPAPWALRDATSLPLAARVIDWSGAASYMSSMRANRLVLDLWLASSFTLVLFLVIGTALFHRRKRDWAGDTLCGLPVLVSPDVGPAVVGLVHSRVVVPRWVMDEPAEQQRYVMAHEQSHLKARDPLLVAVAMTLLVAMPWSPLLWWQFHRLRRAIEVDCDARVLGSGGDLRGYCETLIHVGQNQSEYTGAITAMSESPTFLEQRIRIMLARPRKWARASAFVLASVALGMAVFAAQVTPPEATRASADNTVHVAPGLLASYVGTYEISDTSSITVRRKGDGLSVEPIGQFSAAGVIDMTTLGDDTFLVPYVDATLQFSREGAAISVHGQPFMTAPRVDEARAKQIRDALAARVREQKPYPASENALRVVLAHSRSRDGISPRIAPDDPANFASQAGYFAKLGPVQSWRFNGVTDYGWDSYDVQHQNGAEQVFFLLDRDGMIVSSVVRRQ